MPDDPSRTAMPPLLKGVLIFLGVSASAGTAYLATPSGDLILPASLTLTIASAFGALLLVWIGWTYFLWVRDSKREVIKDAISKGRSICPCTKTGEIMLFHHGVSGELEVHACPCCTYMEVTSPSSDVYITADTEFMPPLPKKVRDEWLRKSRNQR